jgi:hypothetical protein
MKTLTLNASSNFRDLEEAFDAILKNNTLQLQLPESLHNKGIFGLEGLACQLVATWLRNHKNKSILHTTIKDNSPEAFKNFNNSLLGIISLALADEIHTANNTVVDMNTALDFGYNRIKSILHEDYKSAYDGLYLSIPAIKRSGKNKEYNNPFYIQKKLIDSAGFKKITKNAISAVVPEEARYEYIKSSIKNVSEIIRELFENTDEHGRENEKGDILETNFRAVTFSSSKITISKLQSFIDNDVPGVLGFFIENEEWMKKNNSDLPVLDITIVDSGPGYARCYTKKSKEEISFSEEIEAIVKCFEKNKTSKKDNYSGSGLTHVINDLKRLRGWFRLRTGAVSVSKSFFLGGNSEHTTITPRDVYQEKVFIEGTSFNIVIPLVDITGRGKPNV